MLTDWTTIVFVRDFIDNYLQISSLYRGGGPQKCYWCVDVLLMASPSTGDGPVYCKEGSLGNWHLGWKTVPSIKGFFFFFFFFFPYLSLDFFLYFCAKLRHHVKKYGIVSSSAAIKQAEENKWNEDVCFATDWLWLLLQVSDTSVLK